jgi:hypothetical protein
MSILVRNISGSFVGDIVNMLSGLIPQLGLAHRETGDSHGNALQYQIPVCVKTVDCVKSVDSKRSPKNVYIMKQ